MFIPQKQPIIPLHPKQLNQPKNYNHHQILNDYDNDSIIVNKNFSINKNSESFLGISVQKQRMYVVQRKLISIFQYFPSLISSASQQSTSRVPTLTKQILLPFEISKYIITDKYICLKSQNKTEIRDNQFQTVYYCENSQMNNSQRQRLLLSDNKRSKSNQSAQENKIPDQIQKDSQINRINGSQNSKYKSLQDEIIEQRQLECQILKDDLILWKSILKKVRKNHNPLHNEQYQFVKQYRSQRINILTKYKSITVCQEQTIDQKKFKQKPTINKKPPLFIDQLGYIQNFYIWPHDQNNIQIGIVFNKKAQDKYAENAVFEISNFQLKSINIQRIFYYNCSKKNQNSQINLKQQDGPHLFIVIGRNLQKQSNNTQNVKIIIFEVSPGQKIPKQQDANEALNNCIDQIKSLSKQKSTLQHSISTNLLLNEIMTQRQSNSNANSKSSKESKTTLITEEKVLKDSIGLKKVIYNPETKVLWLGDTFRNTYKIQLAQQKDLLKIKSDKKSLFEKIEQYRNSQALELEEAMYDLYPIYKRNTFALQIGLRQSKKFQNQTSGNHNNSSITKINHQEANAANISKQIPQIEFNDQQVEKIEQQMLMKAQTPKKTYAHFQTQTESQFIQKQEDKSPVPISQQITFTSASQLLKQLNFQKVQDTLIRFSTLFVSSLSKNINKLKQINIKSKEQIKTKISNDIFDLISQVFQSLMNENLGQKIQKQVFKSRQFIQKIYNKQVEHFNLFILQEKTKQEQYFKKIIEQQLRSLEVMKQTSFKFLDITKIRQMHKIAYNQIVIENIKQVASSLKSIEQKITQMLKRSQQTQKQIFLEIQQIKDIFKLLIQQQTQNQSQNENIQKENQKIPDNKDFNYNAQYGQSSSSSALEESSDTQSVNDMNGGHLRYLEEKQYYQAAKDRNNYSRNSNNYQQTPFYQPPMNYQEANQYNAPFYRNVNNDQPLYSHYPLPPNYPPIRNMPYNQNLHTHQFPQPNHQFSQSFGYNYQNPNSYNSVPPQQIERPAFRNNQSMRQNQYNQSHYHGFNSPDKNFHSNIGLRQIRTKINEQKNPKKRQKITKSKNRKNSSSVVRN